MAQTLKKKVPQFLTKLRAAFRHTMPGCEIETQRIRGTNRYRVGVVWPGFPKTNQLRRQERVWKLADEVLTDEELLRVSMIIALRPDELRAVR